MRLSKLIIALSLSSDGHSCESVDGVVFTISRSSAAVFISYRGAELRFKHLQSNQMARRPP
jgi:hypothetical protein